MSVGGYDIDLEQYVSAEPMEGYKKNVPNAGHWVAGALGDEIESVPDYRLGLSGPDAEQAINNAYIDAVEVEVECRYIDFIDSSGNPVYETKEKSETVSFDEIDWRDSGGDKLSSPVIDLEELVRQPTDDDVIDFGLFEWQEKHSPWPDSYVVKARAIDTAGNTLRDSSSAPIETGEKHVSGPVEYDWSDFADDSETWYNRNKGTFRTAKQVWDRIK